MSITAPLKSADEVARELERQEQSPEEKVDALQDPRLAEDYEFDLNYTDLRGRTWKGHFKNRVLDMAGRRKVAIIKASRFAPFPLSCYTETDIAEAEQMAHLTVSLIKRPDWFEGDKPEGIKDPMLVNAIYEEVAAHEATFHGRRSPAKAGDGESADAPR